MLLLKVYRTLMTILQIGVSELLLALGKLCFLMQCMPSLQA